MSAKARECTPHVSYDTNLNKKIKCMNEYQWVQPKNYMPMKYF